MKTIEGRLASKDGDIKTCEDAVVVTDDFACVMDGTTSKSDRLWDGKKSGQIASMLISEAVSSLRKDININEAVQVLTASISDYYNSRDEYEALKKDPIHRLTASVALYSNYHREVWLIGDIQAMVDGEIYTNKIVLEEILTSARALYLEMELLRGKSIDELIESDPGRQFIKPLLEGQSLYQNSITDSPYSYSVIDGFPVSGANIKTVKVKEGAKYLILASDGYPFLKSTLKESEEALERLLNQDPLCIRLYKSTKGLKKGNISYDDRAYLKIEV